MSKIRFQALTEALNRKPVEVIEDTKRSELFGKNVFNENSMRQYLTKDAYKGVMSAIDHGTKIDRKIADQVSSSMKEWALSKGVTHYTHWFQPLTGATAEKHDAFFETIG
ncbi:glutamine synthetase III, partial [uncultured Lutibacter sp.]|uniref:glutamine synthetase III n=1 Tax=uncultured Lutibacter sp. TaxID=437739 RepID=UPI0026201A3E